MNSVPALRVSGMDKDERYTVVKWVRADVPCDHGDMTHRQALDTQRELTKKEGAKDPRFIYTIEESS